MMEKIDHKQVRVLHRDAAEKAPPDVVAENKLMHWADALLENAMRIAAAGVLKTQGSLEKAASVLWWAGFRVPPGYFPDAHEGVGLSAFSEGDEEALQLWVEREAEKIEGVLETVGFYLAGTGRLLDPVEEHLPSDD